MNSRQITRCLLALLLLISFDANDLMAQQKRISGKVINQETQEPLQGVTVNVKGQLQATTTDAGGVFNLSGVNSNSVLIFSYVGFADQEVKVGSQSSFNISLTPGASKLNEVVVVGYGQVKKRDLTGAVVSIKGNEITKIPTSNAIEAIQGKVPGADIIRANGYAGKGASIRIRGTRSIGNPSSSNSVLYIVDGVQGVSISDIDPNDIASIDVLKDASSTAIYGSRGANGIIIITTKHGTSGKPRFTFSTYSGISNVAGYGKFMTGPEYVAFKREAYRAAGKWNSPADDANVFNPQELNAINKGQYVSWPDMLLHQGAQQHYQIGVSGGSDRTKVYFSAGYYHEKGILKLDDYKRFSSRLNVDQQINSWLKTGIQSQFAYINNDIRRDPFNQASKTPPLGAAFDSSGHINLYPLNGKNINPLADEQPGVYKRNTKTTRFTGSAYLELTPIRDLDIKSTFSTTMSSGVAGNFYDKATIDGKNSKSQASLTNTQNTFISWENLLTYKKQIGEHSFTLTGVTSYLSNIATSSYAGGNNQLFASQTFYNLGAASQFPFYGSGYSKYNLVSFSGRINYSYRGKYLLSVTGRSDGSSKLGEGHKWAFFPAVAAGWRVNDEKFMQDQDLFNDLKLRVSYGVAGNDVINPYATQNSLQQIQFSYNDANAALAYGINGTIGNNNLKWELTATKDIGVDFGILNNRISGTIDYYDALTYNLIFPYTLPLSTGVTRVNRNIGKTRNNGIEIGLNTNNITHKNFTWSSNITFTKNKERIVELPNGNVIADDYRETLLEGQSPTIYYDYVKLGIWQLGEEAQAEQYNAIPGDLKIADISGPGGKPDGKITGDDRTVIGSLVPKWSGGFSNDFRYKNFDLNIFFYGRFKYWVSSDYYAKFNRNGGNNGASIDYWTPENPTNEYPRPNQTRSNQYVTVLTEKEVSFVKLRNVTLGYTVPQTVTRRFKIDNFRVYVSGRNLYTISDLKDFDPESEGVIDHPLSRLFVAGVNVTF